jgi:hypothetical protein
LDLAFAEMELVGELATTLPGRLGDVFDDVPDASETVGYKSLSFHRDTLTIPTLG